MGTKQLRLLHQHDNAHRRKKQVRNEEGRKKNKNRKKLPLENKSDLTESDK
jgi:hypothetical protein